MAYGLRGLTEQKNVGVVGIAALAEGVGVTHVVMESTGVYRLPVWGLLEGTFDLMLVNPQHFRAVPGRKTDQKDCEWLAQLLQYGLLRGSFVPPQEIRETARIDVLSSKAPRPAQPSAQSH
jgi:transposase